MFKKILREELLKEGQKYVGQCDVVRRSEEGESFWQTMMANMKKISKNEFLKAINPSNILEPDEIVDDFMADDPESYYAKSIVNGSLYYFLGTSGFEFIWLKN